MAEISNTPCVIIAGGKASRFGTPKGSAHLGGKPLILHVLTAFRSQTSGPIAINGPEKADYADAFEHTAPDLLPGPIGPLAGLHAALAWAHKQEASAVLTAPLDTPFLPRSLLATFLRSGAPTIAKSGGRLHPLIGLWQTSALHQLEEAIASGIRSVGAAADILGARSTEFELVDGIDPFYNINTQIDLAQAEKLQRVSRALSE